jgi:hypothetical protein
VNVVVEVPIRALEQVYIPSPSSRLVFSQLKEKAASDVDRGGRIEALEAEAVGDVLGVLPVCRRADDVDDKEGNVWDDIEDDNVDNKEDDICQVDIGAVTDVGRDSVTKIGSGVRTPDTIVEDISTQLVEQTMASVASRLFPGSILHSGWT